MEEMAWLSIPTHANGLAAHIEKLAILSPVLLLQIEVTPLRLPDQCKCQSLSRILHPIGRLAALSHVFLLQIEVRPQGLPDLSKGQCECLSRILHPIGSYDTCVMLPSINSLRWMDLANRLDDEGLQGNDNRSFPLRRQKRRAEITECI
ncbi:unnamed protein product [Victoria cruziana]